MDRAELFNRAEALADMWTRGEGSAVLDQIFSYPPPLAAAMAVIVLASGLDELFNEGAAFRSALTDRALAAQ